MTTAREKLAARKTLARAVRSGRLTRPEHCEQCKKTGEIHGHHSDYSKPLEVTWLCQPCHVAIHAGERIGRTTTGGRRRAYAARDLELEAHMRAAQLAYGAAVRERDALRDERDCMIGDALADGWTHARIAIATGMTRGRVGQIAQTFKDPR